MASEDWLVRDDLGDGVTRITLSAAPVNALTAENLMGMGALFDRLAADDSVRAVIIDSAFKVYSAGLNLKAAQDFELSDQNAILEGFNHGFNRLFAFPKPVIAAVNGAAIAGGLFFVLCADHRVAVPGASFGLAEVRVGADLPAGPMEIARAMLSPNDLRRLMQRGQPYGAEAALTAGIVDEIVVPDALAAAALAAAREFAALPGMAFASIKQQIRGEVTERIDRLIAEGANTPKGGWFNAETRAAMARMIGGK